MMKLLHLVKHLSLIGILGLLFLILNGCQTFLNDQTILVEGYISVNEQATETSLIPRPDSPAMVELFSLADFKANDGEVPEKIIAASAIKNGQVSLKVSVAEPILCVISLTMGDDEPSRAQVMLKPGAYIKFVLINEIRGGTQLISHGVDDRSIKPDQKFAVSGDASLLPPRFDVDKTQVLLGIPEYNESGSKITRAMTFVLVDDNQFHLTGDIEEPTLAELLFIEGTNYAFTSIVLEPQTNYTLKQLDKPGTFHFVADRPGAHSELIESWRLDPEYRRLIKESKEAWDEFTNVEMSEAKRLVDHPNEVSNDELEVDQNIEQVNLDFATRHPAAPECEHVDLMAVIGDFGETSDQVDLPLYEVLDKEAETIKENILKKVLDTTTDPHIALIAINLGALGSDAKSLQEKIDALDSLAKEFPPATVETKITPTIQELKNELSRWQQENVIVIPGQLAPSFTLATIDGDDVSLDSVLQEKEAVLVDFWASWCGPCIATFPALKKMYTTYQPKGFEIIGISIDDTPEAWESGLDENELPWINLGDTNEAGEMVGWNSTTALDYGISFIPQSFLIDREGCILQKDLSTDDLEQVLAARWGVIDEESE